MMRTKLASRAIFAGGVFCVAGSVLAQGLYRHGSGARSQGMAGADAAHAEEPLSAMRVNPAGLGAHDGVAADVALLSGSLSGEFRNAANPNGGRLSDSWRFGGEAAVAAPIKGRPLTLGLSVIPEAALEADWRYNDTDPDGPGGTFVAYPTQQHTSEILVLRSAFGISWEITPEIAVGASAGLIYNDNRLTAPYIFQTQPALAGLKTLLDLETDGFGYDGSFGAIWKATEKLTLGLAYRTPATVHSSGRARGDATAQAQEAFDPAPPFPAGAGAFEYDAEVVNRFPQTVTAGASFDLSERWRVAAQVEWVDWSQAFDDLEVNLANGSNATINGLVGSGSMQDRVLLQWRDQYVVRGGVEFAATREVSLRAGYAYARSPVPEANLLPLVAAISEHTFATGVAWRRGKYGIGLAYQYSLPAEESVGQSALRSGEYSFSNVEVSAHALSLALGVRF